MKITVSAPGKLMLFGEHSVVYGHPCIVTAINQRVYVSADRSSGRDIVNAPQVNNTEFVEEAIRVFKKENDICDFVEISTKSDFSCSVGLGSSSAVIVATIKALCTLFNISYSDKKLFETSYRVVMNVKGVGSGFDISAATHGGTIYFDGESKRSEPINMNSLSLVVGYSGTKADTPKLVREVKKKYEKNMKKYKFLFSSITDLVQDAYIASIAKDIEKIGKLLTKNHDILKEIGVSTSKLNKMVESAIGAGAYGAKLSGAGGGDCMIALSPSEKIERVECSIEEVGGTIVHVEANAEGVRVETD